MEPHHLPQYWTSMEHVMLELSAQHCSPFQSGARARAQISTCDAYLRIIWGPCPKQITPCFEGKILIKISFFKLSDSLSPNIVFSIFLIHMLFQHCWLLILDMSLLRSLSQSRDFYGFKQHALPYLYLDNISDTYFLNIFHWKLFNCTSPT